MKTLTEHTNDANNETDRFQILATLFFIGFIMIFTGITILVLAKVLSGGTANFSAVIFIGPIPIVMGTGPQTTWIILIAIILAILTILATLTVHKKKTQ